MKVSESTVFSVIIILDKECAHNDLKNQKHYYHIIESGEIIMNIGERFFCSKCLCELEEENICCYCGYDPTLQIDVDALEEGTLLQNGRYQIGAVRTKDNVGYTYGAYDHIERKTRFLFEVFPENNAVRDRVNLTVRITTETFPENTRLEYLKESCITEFEENNTVYYVLTANMVNRKSAV